MKKVKELKSIFRHEKVREIEMKEEDIRPSNLMKEDFKLWAKDMKQLMKHKRKFTKILCPVCSANNYKTIFKKGGFIFVKCAECETVFINPRPTMEMLARYYATSKEIKYWNDKVFPASEDARRNQIFLPRAKKVVEICNKHKVAMKTLIDIGAGFGTFCEEIKKMSIFDKVIAVEPSHALAETCRRKGLDIIEKPIEKINLEEIKKLNVITCFELIEHLYCPKDFLLSCSKILPKGGMLILTTPNIKGFDLLVLGELSDNIGGPNHLNYFHSKSINNLLRACGFKIIEIQTPGKLDAELVRKKIMSGEFKVSNQPFLKEVLIERWEELGGVFQKFLAENTLSSHLWIVAKKI